MIKHVANISVIKKELLLIEKDLMRTQKQRIFNLYVGVFSQVWEENIGECDG